VPDIDQRDPDEVARTLGAWLATRLPPGADPVVANVEAPASTGFSNETILCEATWADHDADPASGGGPTKLVVRVAPTKHQLFLDADFSLQYRVMRTLTDGGIPIALPPLRWYEEDPRWFGVPFFVMDHVHGLVPGEPTYDNAWLMDASAKEQDRLWWSGLESLARIHETDWRALGLGWLDDTARGAPGAGQQMAYYRDFFDWTRGERDHPVTDAAWAWLEDHRPEESGDVVFCWGDSRIGNIIWEDFEPAAVLDWEMATLARPELDLGWWLYFDRQFAEGLSSPRPAGFPSRDETIDWYAQRLGRPMRDVFWYEVFSGVRFAVIMCRLSDLLVGTGILPEDSDMATNNIATQLVARMLELPGA
jgi:aminoglycoside phosphotransferase (APT) family kinase protein